MRKSKAERFLEAFGDIDDKYLEEAMNYTMKKKFNKVTKSSFSITFSS